MSLATHIEQDYKEAFKRGVREAIDTLRLVKAAIKNAEIEKRSELTDADTVAVLKREAKKRQDAVVLFQKGQRPELAAREQKELEIISRYLPASATPEQVRAAVESAVVKLGTAGPQDFGRVMKAAMAELGASADGQAVSAAVKAKLG